MTRKTNTEKELDDILVRVTRAEERLITANQLVTVRHAELKESLEDIDKRMRKMEAELTRYHGFAGGIMLALTALGAFLSLFWGYISRKLGLLIE